MGTKGQDHSGIMSQYISYHSVVGLNGNDKLRHLILIYLRCALSESNVNTANIKGDIVKYLKTVGPEEIQYELLNVALNIVEDSELAYELADKLTKSKCEESNLDLDFDDNKIYEKPEEIYSVLRVLERLSLYERAYFICNLNQDCALDLDTTKEDDRESNYSMIPKEERAPTPDKKMNPLKEKMVYYGYRINLDKLLIESEVFPQRIKEFESFMNDYSSFRSTCSKLNRISAIDKMNIVECFVTSGYVDQIKNDENHNKKISQHFSSTLLNVMENIYKKSDELYPVIITPWLLIRHTYRNQLSTFTTSSKGK